MLPWWRTTTFNTEALELQEIKESPVEQLEPPEENVEQVVKVEALADEKVTVEMHDDTTILRQVEADDGDARSGAGFEVNVLSHARNVAETSAPL